MAVVHIGIAKCARPVTVNHQHINLRVIFYLVNGRVFLHANALTHWAQWPSGLARRTGDRVVLGLSPAGLSAAGISLRNFAV